MLNAVFQRSPIIIVVGWCLELCFKTTKLDFFYVKWLNSNVGQSRAFENNGSNSHITPHK